jgi:hypothetical protein
MLREELLVDVYDLRGLPLGDPERKRVAGLSSAGIGGPLPFIHLESTRWYFDASDPTNEDEAARVIAVLCFRGETASARGYDSAYRADHVVVDNYGGHIVGALKVAS